MLRRCCVGAAWLLRRCCVGAASVWCGYASDAYGLRVCCLLDVSKCIEDTLKKEKKEMQREHTN